MKNRLAIIGMGCTRFGDLKHKRWSELAAESIHEAMADAEIDGKEVEACWLDTRCNNFTSFENDDMLGRVIKLQQATVQNTVNDNKGNTIAFHRACHAIASGSCDVALVLGAEKQNLSEFGENPLNSIGIQKSIFTLNPHLINQFALKANEYFTIHGLSKENGKKALARIAYKNHKNGALHRKAYQNHALSFKEIINAPIVNWPLGILDCSPVSNGAAAVIICRADKAARYRRNPVYIKAHQVFSAQEENFLGINRHGVHLKTTRNAAISAYKEADIKNPREEINILETHDSCTMAELLNCEDLLISKYGKAIEDIDSGFYDLDGKLPSQTDGGLKCWGDPVGASLIRMIYEVYKQLQCKVEGDRQITTPLTGLVHHVGGDPFMSAAYVNILSTR